MTSRGSPARDERRIRRSVGSCGHGRQSGSANESTGLWQRSVAPSIPLGMSNHLAALETWLRSRSESDDERESQSENDSDRGAALVEYALLVAFVAIVCVG